MGINYRSLNWWGTAGFLNLQKGNSGSFGSEVLQESLLDRMDPMGLGILQSDQKTRRIQRPGPQPWGPGCFWLIGSSALFWGVKKRPSKDFGCKNKKTFTLNRGHGWVLGMSEKIRSIIYNPMAGGWDVSTISPRRNRGGIWILRVF